MAARHRTGAERQIFLNARVTLAAILLLPGCSGSGSDTEQQVKQARTSAATAQMVLDAWLPGEVPAHYARDTLQAMQAQLEGVRKNVEQAGSSSPARQAVVLHPIRQTSDAIGRAAAAIGASDHERTAKSAEEARTAAAVLSLRASGRTSIP